MASGSLEEVACWRLAPPPRHPNLSPARFRVATEHRWRRICWGNAEHYLLPSTAQFEELPLRSTKWRIGNSIFLLHRRTWCGTKARLGERGLLISHRGSGRVSGETCAARRRFQRKFVAKIGWY